MLACQEVTFLSHSNLFIGFADYQREKIFIDDSFLIKRIDGCFFVGISKQITNFANKSERPDI